MSLTKDCGDLTVAVTIRTGVKFRLSAATDEDRLERSAIDLLIAEILPALEKTLLEQVCDHIGYDEETIAVKVKARDDKNAADHTAETEGRAAKAAHRAGLPEPPPGQIGEPVLPGKPITAPESVEGLDGQPHQE